MPGCKTVARDMRWNMFIVDLELLCDVSAHFLGYNVLVEAGVHPYKRVFPENLNACLLFVIAFVTILFVPLFARMLLSSCYYYIIIILMSGGLK